MHAGYLFEVFLFQVGIHLSNKIPFLKAIAEIDFLPNVSTDENGENNLAKKDC